MNISFSRADKSLFSEWWWTVDRSIIVALIALIGFGVVLVSAASPPVAERIGVDQFHFVKKHIVFLAPALFTLFSVSLLTPKYVWRLSTIVFSFSVLAMLWVLFFGVEVKGAQRWMSFFGFSLQPSEFAKVSFAVIVAWFMARQADGMSVTGHKIAAGLYILLLCLLLLQPDFGMSFVVTCVYGVQIFLAGFPFSWMLLFVFGAAIFVVGSYFSFDHVQSRIDRFLDPTAGDNYQVEKSIEAFRNGGLFGTGPGQGTVKLSLPDAHSDFIFAVAGEELGLVFVIILIGVFAFVLLRGLNRAMDSNDMFVILASGGLLTIFAMQALVHMGSSLSLLPAKGMTLPFVSYGGSSMVAMAYAMGMVLSLTRHRKRESVSKKTYSGRVSE
jgi:cell division protein FtsW